MKSASSGAGWRNIINIGSIEGLASNRGHPAYSASKAGIHGFTAAVAVDHGLEGSGAMHCTGLDQF
ncbi:SDR family NAD(P)-dependent oxidoreductase [Mesorhizobium sp. M1339]|uniref:SDR family NAD(P)-dependent oxidoreductase n=1 Tax=Mesorhizobium sp. M1339 TaxID=2957086 RepID=UPI0033358280